MSVPRCIGYYHRYNSLWLSSNLIMSLGAFWLWPICQKFWLWPMPETKGLCQMLAILVFFCNFSCHSHSLNCHYWVSHKNGLFDLYLLTVSQVKLWSHTPIKSFAMSIGCLFGFLRLQTRVIYKLSSSAHRLGATITNIPLILWVWHILHVILKLYKIVNL